eukprot:scaffold91108_cov65-Phaeocystis_antarctica.AAC.1
MVMSTAQQQAFERALVNMRALVTFQGEVNFRSIEASLSRVDVRQVRAAPWLHSGCSLCEHTSSTIPHCAIHLLGA